MSLQNDQHSNQQKERKISIKKSDLERAIRDGIIPLEAATALWKSWRGKQDLLESKPTAFSHVTALDSDTVLTAAIYLLFCSAAIALALFSWAKWGALGAAAASAVASLSLIYLATFLEKAPYPSRLGCKLASPIIMAYAFVEGSAALGLTALSPKIQFDVFGAIPAGGSLRVAIFATISTIGYSLLCSAERSKILLGAALVGSYIAAAEFLAIFGGRLFPGSWVEPTGYIAAALLLSLGYRHVAPGLIADTLPPQAVSKAFEVVTLLSATKFVLDGTLGGAYYLTVSAAFLVSGLAYREKYRFLLGAAGLILSMCIIIWILFAWTVLAPLFIAILGGLTVMAKRNWERVEVRFSKKKNVKKVIKYTE